jgi:hypothetical protein
LVALAAGSSRPDRAGPGPTVKPMSAILVRRKVILLLVYMGLFVLTVYTFLHEAGHAAAGLLLGGAIYSFSFNFLDASAHVGISGSFTALERSMINLSGAALPVTVWFFFMQIAPLRANPALELLKTISSAGLLGSLIPWMLVPLAFMVGAAPEADDVTYFLTNSGLPPLLVAAGGMLLFFLGVQRFIQRSSGESYGLEQVTQWLRGGSHDPAPYGARYTLAVMGVILVILALMAVTTQATLNT